MIGYASRTGTRRNLDALRRAGWRLLVSATGVWRAEGFGYGIDNGAWTAHQAGTQFDEDLFTGLVAKMADKADWIVIPDIVAGGLESLDYSLGWLPSLSGRLLLAVQDGMEPAHVKPHLSVRVGIFIGGSTEFKERSAEAWGLLAREVGCYLHMGRVNSQRRIKIAQSVGCDSFDGTSASRFSVTLWPLDQARRQEALCY